MDDTALGGGDAVAAGAGVETDGGPVSTMTEGAELFGANDGVVATEEGFEPFGAGAAGGGVDADGVVATEEGFAVRGAIATGDVAERGGAVTAEPAETDGAPSG